ncbi:cytochrome c3 family protein [Neobacillus niacini]|uniref:cytochrome c3 family protein n=1 Tax=Neobacillus niacini TaxID=86668 RepID=UPI0005EF60C0|nr:cytochrome c3 family protein [Neobacillus niacini]
MKKNVLIYQQILYSFLIILIVGASIFSFPSTNVFSAIGDKPTISIGSPTSNVLLNTTEVVISGTYTDDNVQKEGLLFTAYDKEVKISDSTTNVTEWNIDENGTDKTWTFSTTLSEGIHDLSIEIKEIPPADETMSAKQSVTIIINKTRPFITETGILLPDNTILVGEDFTRVPLEAKIKITVADDEPMIQLVNKIEATTNPYNPINVMVGAKQISGTAEINDLGNQAGLYKYEILFTPDSNSLDWKLNTTYVVYIDSLLVDDANNLLYAKSYKFTTRSDMKDNDNPHGHYIAKTNMCAACHSSHGGSSNSLVGVYYQDRFKEELQADPSSNYCMACHDGTMNAPIIDQIDKKYNHNNPVEYSESEVNELKNADSCTSCHNPHSGWSKENQNLLKDHYVYKHKEAHPEKGLETLTVDSLETSCITCHEDDAIYDRSKYPDVVHEVFSYNKSITTEGAISTKINDPNFQTINDYSLCLRCHNTDKNKNIEKYYLQTNSGHYFTIPEGKQTNVDGSKLNGPIPCAECHDTHGSNNIKLLREQFGNIKTEDTFNKSEGDWIPSEERDFCLKCHNKSIEIYGRAAEYKEINGDGDIIGHRSIEDKDVRCSTCHGGESKTFIEAAHSPGKLPK